MVPPGALLTVVCSCVGWLSHCDPGSGQCALSSVCTGLVSGYIDLFGWSSVVLCEDAGIRL